MRGMRCARLAAAALLATSWATAGGTPASAQSGPTITVTPSSGLHHGDTVDVTVTGMGSLYGIFQCGSAVLDDLEHTSAGPCIFLHVAFGAADPLNIQPTLRGTFTASDGEVVRCGVSPGDCAIVAWSPNVGGPWVATTIDMEPTPLVVEGTQQEAGHPVRALVTLPGRAAAELAQCVVPVDGDEASNRCSPPQAVTLDADGFADVDFTLVGEIPGDDGSTTCGVEDCAVTLFGTDGTTLGSVPVTTYAPDGPIDLTLRNGELVFPYGDTTVVADGVRNDEFDMALCDASVVAAQDVAGGPCHAPQHFGPVTHESQVEAQIPTPPTFTGADGSPVACEAAGDCVIAARTTAGAFDSVPVRFWAPDTVTLTPQSGLLDEQAITVDASGLEPSTDYRVLRCDRTAHQENGFVDDDLCESRLDGAPVVTSSAGGTLSTTVRATQRFERAGGGTQHCRDNCAVVVTLSPQGWPELAIPHNYVMATGTLAASPATGLSDGQPVAVAGTDLMPTYDGPAWWILQTGEWAVGQCGAGLLGEPTVAGVFRHCVVPPGGGAVTVTGSTVTRTIEAQATFQPAIGEPVDCTTGPEACLAILTRVEEDGRLTLLSTPLTFA